MLIYSATNTINGKVYIGQTVGTLSDRKKQHKYDAYKRCANKTSIYFYNAIRKYGWGAFEWSVLEEHDDQDVINELEKWYIKCIGDYNVCKGGHIGHTAPHTEEAKKKIGDSNRGAYLCIASDRAWHYTDDLASFCNDNSLVYGGMVRVANGYASHHHGWYCERIA